MSNKLDDGYMRFRTLTFGLKYEITTKLIEEWSMREQGRAHIVHHSNSSKKVNAQ